MNRFSEQARYVPELPRNAELLQITGIRLQRIHFLMTYRWMSVKC
ncbi:hypothetical protein PXV97_19510 [Citrobacter freundii]|nr:hypothetical protein PXV97_19510 [Citrobacter freundii]